MPDLGAGKEDPLPLSKPGDDVMSVIGSKGPLSCLSQTSTFVHLHSLQKVEDLAKKRYLRTENKRMAEEQQYKSDQLQQHDKQLRLEQQKMRRNKLAQMAYSHDLEKQMASNKMVFHT